MFTCSFVLADQTWPSIFIWPLPVAQSISSITIAFFPVREYTLVFALSFWASFFTKGFVANISNPDEIVNEIVVNKLHSLKG